MRGPPQPSMGTAKVLWEGTLPIFVQHFLDIINSLMYCVVYQRYNCLGKRNIRIFRSRANSGEVLYSVYLNSLWTINSSTQTHLGCSCSASPRISQISACTLIPPLLLKLLPWQLGVIVMFFILSSKLSVCSALFPSHHVSPHRQLQFSVSWNNYWMCKCF